MNKLLKSTPLILLLATGCKAAHVEATVTNHTGGPITLIEVQYPSASFGKEALADNAYFSYRFKILGNGPTKVTWTDEAKKEHNIPGPSLQEGQDGALNVTLTGDTATWGTNLHR